MDNSQSVTDNIYPAIDGITKCIEKELPASQSTASTRDGDDDERNLDHQEDSTDGIIPSTNEKSQSSRTYAEKLQIIALSLTWGILIVAFGIIAINLSFYYIKHGELYVNCHVALMILSVIYPVFQAIFLLLIIYWMLQC